MRLFRTKRSIGDSRVRCCGAECGEIHLAPCLCWELLGRYGDARVIPRRFLSFPANALAPRRG